MTNTSDTPPGADDETIVERPEKSSASATP